MSAGWHHLAAIKANDRLKLYVDGVCVAESTKFDPSDYDLTSKKTLKIGVGQHDYFNGQMKDLRIYNRALSAAEIAKLAKQR